MAKKKANASTERIFEQIRNQRTDEWRKSWMDEQMEGYTRGWMDKPPDGRTNKQMDGWIDG